MILCDDCATRKLVINPGVKYYLCALCGKEQRHPNDAVPLICRRCSEKHRFCQRCGERVPMYE